MISPSHSGPRILKLIHRFFGTARPHRMRPAPCRMSPRIAATIACSTVWNRDGADLLSMDHSASALRTSDWEIPKCRAIRDGVTPALKAARTALIFAWGNETATALTRRFGEVSADTAGFLPRRSCSASTAASNRSSSRS